MGISHFSNLFSQKREGPRGLRLLIPVWALPQSWDNTKSPRKLHEGQRKMLSQCFSIFAKITITRQRMPIFGAGSSSLARPVLVC